MVLHNTGFLQNNPTKQTSNLELGFKICTWFLAEPAILSPNLFSFLKNEAYNFIFFLTETKDPKEIETNHLPNLLEISICHLLTGSAVSSPGKHSLPVPLCAMGFFAIICTIICSIYTITSLVQVENPSVLTPRPPTLLCTLISPAPFPGAGCTL